MRSCTILLAAGLAGCSMAPRYTQPVPPIAQTFPLSQPPPGAVPANQVSWRDFFEDPRLEIVAS